MAVYAIIPARMESTRLPGKMLLAETGRPLVEHTYLAAEQAELVDKVFVATDSAEIFRTIKARGWDVVYTPPCNTGSDRCYSALLGLEDRDADVIVNLQGDWPEIHPADIDRMVSALFINVHERKTDITTLAVPLRNAVENPSEVKVVVDALGRAMYFSRSLIPYRDTGCRLLHMGAYAFHRRSLMAFAKSLQTPLELNENLEQLRALEIGLTVRVVEAKHSARGIDTRADYDAFVERMRNAR